ncbi:hypothetical protein J4217_04930 [Candidatus Pacearchaeota archaeon]|nr:hypothetical protein [Candidatus Pacearchaeota archaeon]
MAELSFKKIFIPLDVEKEAIVKAGDRVFPHGKLNYIEREEGVIPKEFRKKAIFFFSDLEELVKTSNGKVIEGEIYSNGETKTNVIPYDIWKNK